MSASVKLVLGVLLIGSSAFVMAQQGGGADAEVVVVYKSPTCGCCGDWIDHLVESGYAVEVHDVANLAEVKAEAGIPSELGSCHTALVAGYLIEGHVPAEDITRLLEETPEVAGLAVPGMPIGSPGMEIPGAAAQPYDVIAFDKQGGRSVWASH